MINYIIFIIIYNMSSKLEDIISQCDKLMAETKIISHTTEISRLELIIANYEKQIQKLKEEQKQSQTKISSMIKQQRRISDDEYFKQFTPQTFTQRTIYDCPYTQVVLQHNFNIIKLANIEIITEYTSAIQRCIKTYYLSDSGYLIIHDERNCESAFSKNTINELIELINIPFLTEYEIKERKIEFEFREFTVGYKTKIGYKNMNTDRINLSGDIMDRIKAWFISTYWIKKHSGTGHDTKLYFEIFF